MDDSPRGRVNLSLDIVTRSDKKHSILIFQYKFAPAEGLVQENDGSQDKNLRLF